MHTYNAVHIVEVLVKAARGLRYHRLCVGKIRKWGRNDVWIDITGSAALTIALAVSGVLSWDGAISVVLDTAIGSTMLMWTNECGPASAFAIAAPFYAAVAT
jgi:hypothetical protein